MRRIQVLCQVCWALITFTPDNRLDPRSSGRENDVHSSTFLVLLLSFLIDSFQAVFPHLLDCFFFLNTLCTCFLIPSTRRRYNSFFLCCVFWGFFVVWYHSFSFTEHLFQHMGQTMLSHWDDFQPSHLVLYLPESLILPYCLLLKEGLNEGRKGPQEW